MTDASAPAQSSHDVPPEKMRLVVVASAAGTVFEWYDFFVYGALASVIAPLFFAGLPDAQAFVFTLLTFAVGFVVRPLGALVFGKIGDSAGRKGAFLITITIMGIATFLIGILPTGNVTWTEYFTGQWVSEPGAETGDIGVVAAILLV